MVTLNSTHTQPRLLALTAALGLSLTAATACSTPDTESTPGTPGTGTGPVHVVAAASLAPLEEELTAAYPNLKFNFQGSTEGLRQITQGAPADLFISANAATMDKAQDTGLFRPATTIATNQLAIILPPDTPGDIHSLDDLATKRVALCAPKVPCGVLAREALGPRSLTKPNEVANATQVRTAVATGMVDAGIAYTTDAPDAEHAIPITTVAPNEYQAAATTPAGEEVQRFLRTPAAQEIFRAHGFGAAP